MDVSLGLFPPEPLSWHQRQIKVSGAKKLTALEKVLTKLVKTSKTIFTE
jgi:hypothetical protein